VSEEISPASLRRGQLCSSPEGFDSAEFIWYTPMLASYVSLDIFSRSFNITRYIESVSRSLGDSEAVVEGNTSWYSPEA
jgi:hypothetical protein